MARYEIYADEAWTHGGTPATRYFCFYGGIIGLTPALDRLDAELRKITAAHGANGEAKWSNLSTKSEPYFRELVQCLCRHLSAGGVRYRQLFCDRAIVRERRADEVVASDLDVQFKLCYQFLKHAFGLKFLPPAGAGQKHEILIRLDTHSSQRHKTDLADFAQDIPRALGRSGALT